MNRGSGTGADRPNCGFSNKLRVDAASGLTLINVLAADSGEVAGVNAAANGKEAR